MSRRDDKVSMNDMLNYAREAVEILGDTDRASFLDQRVMQLALTHLVEIVGEAANRVSDSTKQAHPDIPWPRIIGMRNRLAHGYDVIDYNLLWDTVMSDLPALIESLEKIVAK